MIQNAIDAFIPDTGMCPSLEKTQSLIMYGFSLDEARLPLHCGGKPSHIASTPVKILGIPIDTKGSANPWVENLSTTWHRMLHLIKLIAFRSG